MNPLFILIVVAITACLWVVLNNFFDPIGRVLLDIWRDIKRNLNKEEE